MAMAALMDELIELILLRLPPGEPACLVRAALVCKRWCIIISDPGFRCRLREFHGAPPTIGAVYNAVDGDAYVARFTPCASFPSRADRRGSAVLDCRHGRVLLRGMPPVAVVLCAAVGTCNHLDCHGGPFLVVMVGTEHDNIFVYVYSSEAAACEPSSLHLGGAMLNSDYILTPGLDAGDAIYLILGRSHKIVKYDLGGHVISMIDPPSLQAKLGNMALVEAKDGGFAVADVEGYNLHVWSWKASGSNGVESWVKDQVIKLDMVLSTVTGGPSTKFDVVGFGEGTDIIFISANALGPAPCMSFPPSTKVSTKKKRKGDTSSSGKSIRSSGSNQPEVLSIEYPVDSSISEEETEKAATKTGGKKRAGVKEKTEKLKQDPLFHSPAMGTRSKTADRNSSAMSTRSKRRLSH
ncbi:hypothetical protein BAE44_0025803 [Dichanthelium oligosanthes]|uniref:Uncharacterized protein n=1 Tax=Dichanthelium oligosanthes TaxID=888268 RepID=A0A1E5UK41_9POAL|nr:hypothetical protein BAE44_0025803 [Dichanthelium oligosanthes]